MNSKFHEGNRRRLADMLAPGTIAVIYSGEEIRKTNDEYYPFFADRSFVYLTGISEKDMFIDYGATAELQAQNLFALLRKADDDCADTVFVEMPSQDGVGLAVYNRLLRAAGFKVVRND